MCVARFNPYGTILATGCTDGQILLWSWETRTLVRRLEGYPESNPSRIVALSWNRSGHHLQSASKNGTVTVWDVATGKSIQQWTLDADGSEVCALSGSTPLSFDDSSCAVSFAPPRPACFVTFQKELCIKSQIPFVDLKTIVLEKESRPTGRGRKGEGNLLVRDFYVAEVSPTGDVLLSASYSTIALVRTSDMAILDVVGMRKGWVSGATVANSESSSSPLLIEFAPDGRRVLVTGRSCRLIRVFDFFNEHQNPAEAVAQCDPITPELIAETVQRQKQPKEEVSLFFTSTSNSSRLRLSRVFEASIEKCGGWATAAFSPDGCHIVGAISSEDEHIIYIWNVQHGYAVSTLQAGVGGVEQLCWHPRPVPAQLLAVCSTGKVCVWAKILSQWWSAFAPDFETLEENREHNETETEFDVNEEREKMGKLDQGDTMDCDETLDIETWDWLESEAKSISSSQMWDAKHKPTILISIPVQLSLEGSLD